MTSFVAELLHSSGSFSREDLILKVNDLKKKLESKRLEIHESLKHKYVDFSPYDINLEKLLAQVETVGNDYESLCDQIEKEVKPQMMSSVTEFHDLIEDLSKIKVLKAHVFSLALLHQHLQKAKSQSAFLNAAYHIVEFEKAFKEIDPNLKKDVAILCALRTEFHVTKENIVYEIQNICKQNIIISSNIEGRNKKCVTICINKSICYEDILRTLYLLNNLKPVLKELGNLFLKHVCEIIIMNTVSICKSDINCTLDINILNEHSPQPSEVFEKNLKTVFQFIYEELLFHEVSDDDGCQITAMNEFGEIISEEFCSLVIEKCLKIAIPKQSKQLADFQKEINEAENFSNFLEEIGFFSVKNHNNNLMNFIKNIDILPINKMIQDILTRARSLMKKSLHQTITVGIESSPVNEIACESNETSRAKNVLSRSTLLFPKCQVSSSVKELVKLLQEVKEEGKNIGSIHAPRMYYTARSICELYCCIVPTFHKEEIKNIPQQTAIFHNNCMYLAHFITTLGNLCRSELQLEIPMTFVDLVPEIRKLGAESFLCQMRHQKQQLLQLIQDQQTYQTVMLDEGIINKAEKSVRQCLCQLQLLQKVWSEILPSEVYFKAIGTLLNTCLEEIILRVVAMEDISANAAAQMDSIFSILLKQGPDLFMITNIDKRNFVHVYVKRWFKFQELQLVMRASLREIVDRWSSGKGPLATHFSADNVKHLIRALFQNTERRAAALAKIR